MSSNNHKNKVDARSNHGARYFNMAQSTEEKRLLHYCSPAPWGAKREEGKAIKDKI
jgi:hypothetical protein